MAHLKYRSQCRCGCHTSLMIHITACCQPDPLPEPHCANQVAESVLEKITTDIARLNQVKYDADLYTKQATDVGGNSST